MTSVSISLRSDVLIFVVSQPSWNKVSQWLHFLEKQLTIFITDASYWKYKESMNCVGGHNAKTECKEVSISWLLLFLFLSFFLLPVLYSTWAAFFNPAHTILPHQAVKFHCSFVKVSKLRACHMSHLIDKLFPPSVLHGLQITMPLAYMYTI